MWGRATLTTVASSIAIALAATVAVSATRPTVDRSTSPSTGAACSAPGATRRAISPWAPSGGAGSGDHGRDARRPQHSSTGDGDRASFGAEDAR